MGLARNAIETFITKGVVALLGMAITVLVARTLGPEGRGVFITAMTIAALGVQIGNFGLASSNIYYASSGRDSVRFLVGNSLFLGVAVSSLVCLVAWVFLRDNPGLIPLHGRILDLTLLWVPVGIGLLLMQNLLLGMHEVRVFNLVELLKQGGTLLAVFIAWLAQLNTPEGYFFVSLMVMVLILAWNIVHILREDGNFPKVSFPLLRDQAKYAIKAYLATLFSYLVLRIDLLMIQYLQGEVQTGLYSVGVAIADVLFLVPVAVGSVLFPRLSSLNNEDDRRSLAVRAIQWTTLVMAVLALVLALGVQVILGLLFGKPYLSAAPAVIVLLPAVVLLGVNTIFMNYFASMGMPMFTVISPGIAAAINIPANYVLIPSMGIVGAAWASLMSYSLMLLMSLLYARLIWMKDTYEENES